ncbi:MAG TPA: hypothetical protein VHO29_01245 [Marmoricola sp.]|nr:hypothetical protein [Marmoricola sp.]
MGDLTPPEGEPGQLTHCTGALGTVSTDLGTQKTAVQHGVATALEQWKGPRRDDFAHAGAGLQVEIAMVQASSQKVAGLVHEYGLALKKTQDDIRAWAAEVEHAESRVGSGDDPDSIRAMQHAAQLRTQLEGEARQAAHRLKQLATTIAGEIDAETDLLVPKSESLDPAAIRRRVFDQLGVTGLDGPITPAQAWASLRSAEAAVPKEDVKSDGEVDWKELADQINNAGPAQLLAGTIGPLTGAEGWAVARFAGNLRDVARVEKNVQTIFADIVGPMSDLYKSGIAGMGDVDAQLDFASQVAKLERTLAGNPEESTASLLSKLKAGGIPETGFLGAVGKFLGVVGVASDVLTIMNPAVENETEGNVIRGAAGLNIVGTGMAFAPGMATLVGINAVADWVPVAGQVVMIGTGLFLAGDWAYHKFGWFHDGVDGVGHVASEGAKKVWDGVKDVGSGIKHVFSSIF